MQFIDKNTHQADGIVEHVIERRRQRNHQIDPDFEVTDSDGDPEDDIREDEDIIANFVND